MASKTRVTFVGTATVIPTTGRESTCLVVNDDLMVDAGWCGALRMVDLGLNPTRIRYFLLTHGHQDHYLGLPALLFYRWMVGQWNVASAPLKVLGPKEEIALLVELTRDFLTKRDPLKDWQEPEVVALSPGDEVELDGYRVRCCRALHPVPALCYRIEDTRTGAQLAVSGDTARNPDLVRLAARCHLLVHEATLVTQKEEQNPYGHSSAEVAAQVAAQASVERLLMVHHDLAQAEKLREAARKHFASSDAAADGLVVELP
ncbi:MAG TPA: ribonuclease Z [Armatimonadota bacterium]